jgi:hypothetical protein
MRGMQRVLRMRTATTMARAFRVLAFGLSGLGVLLVGALLSWSTGTPEDAFAIAVMGGAMAGTPFMLACALDEFLRERQQELARSRRGTRSPDPLQRA